MLRTIAPAQIPTQFYAHGPDHDVRLNRPEHFRPVVTPSVRTKPEPHEGLWTSPGTQWDDVAPLATAWTDYVHGEQMDWVGSHATEIIPDPTARILLIDAFADLRALAEAYPASESYVCGPCPEWSALAADGYSAVYLTDAGQEATRFSTPNLYGWDIECCLWLNPHYTAGQTWELPTIPVCCED